jgi:hypothetical protein
MKTLLNEVDRADIRARLAGLRADTPRQWGRMTAGQMVVHLTDAFRGVTGDRPATVKMPEPTFVSRTLVKWIALHSPMPWPHGLRTRPDVDQLAGGGTRPADFASDVAALETASQRFLQNIDDVASRPHFVFGILTPAEWARWGYLHMDHHLRQFGL